MALARGYVGIGPRRVHYRWQGSGPPLVLLHGSPGDSQMLGAEMDALAAAGHTCIALDTPGFGGSDALPGATLTVPELAAATAAAMAALRLGRCPVYGTHTGAAIALELGVGCAEQVSALVLEGLPMFTASEIEALFEGYFAPLVVDPLGGHLFATWMRFRDQFTWFPWTSRRVSRMNPVDRPQPEDIDLWVSMYYRSARTYGPAYRAACHYGPLAEDAVRRLRLPAVFLASAEDMLYPHLERLPPLPAHQRILPLRHDPEARLKAIARSVQTMPPAEDTREDTRFEPPSGAAGREPALQFVSTPAGPVLLRRYGAPDRPCLLLLHDAPGSGALHMALARELARDFHVLLPDLPGHGESEAPPASADALEAAVAAAAALAGQTAGCTVVGIGVGATVAALLAARAAGGVRSVLLVDLPWPDEAIAAAIAPALPLSADGAHWLRAWMCVRDSQIYSPWFDGRVAAQRRDQGCFDADWLHEQTCALMASRASGHRLPQQVWRHDTRPALAAATVPLVEHRGGCSADFIRHTLLDKALP
jgi:pimeloyl-ACP methyl ester carboxylesterase